MFRSIFKWTQIINLKKSDYVLFFSLTFIEIICFAFSPISFAYITSFAAEQNIQIALLWASINFMLQLLNYFITIIKQQRLIALNSFVYNILYQSKNYKIEDTKYFSNFLFKFNNLILFVFKILSIVFISLIYSIYLTLTIIIALIACFISSFIINKIRTKKQKPELYGYQVLICDTILNCIWLGFSFFIIISAINLISNQNITLTVFLLITTFVSNHISKSELTVKHLINLKELKNRIANLNNKNNVE